MVLLFLWSGGLHAAEIDTFWKYFPGEFGSIEAFDYDILFAETTKPSFVEDVVWDYAAKPSKEKLREYIRVLAFMDPKLVDEQLNRLGMAKIYSIREAAKTISKELPTMRNVTKKK